MVDAVVILLWLFAVMGCEASFKFSVCCVIISCVLIFYKEVMCGKK